MIGLACAVATGMGLGALVHRIAWMRRTLYPLLVVSQTIPVIVLVPLLVVWFGYGLLPKLIIIAIACFFPVAVAVVDGLDSADARMIKLVRSMGARSGQIFWRVNVPAAAPSAFTGLRVAATYAVMAAVVSEWMGADAGLGVYIARSARSFRIDRVFAGVGLVSFYSVLAFAIVDFVRAKLLPWERLSVAGAVSTWHVTRTVKAIKRNPEEGSVMKRIVGWIEGIGGTRGIRSIGSIGGTRRRRWIRRWATRVGLTAAALLFIASVALGREMILQLEWTPNTNHTGIYVALDKGWYEEVGVDLRVITPGV